MDVSYGQAMGMRQGQQGQGMQGGIGQGMGQGMQQVSQNSCSLRYQREIHAHGRFSARLPWVLNVQTVSHGHPPYNLVSSGESSSNIRKQGASTHELWRSIPPASSALCGVYSPEKAAEPVPLHDVSHMTKTFFSHFTPTRYLRPTYFFPKHQDPVFGHQAAFFPTAESLLQQCYRFRGSSSLVAYILWLPSILQSNKSGCLP